MNYNLDFYTEYNQFYIINKESSKNAGSIHFWTKTAFEDRLAQEDGILGVGTQSYGHIKCNLLVLNEMNKEFDADKFDHIVEAGLRVESGKLMVLNCPTHEVKLEIKIKPGTYRVRVYSSNLKHTDIDENEGSDYYKIEIWPSSNMKREVLKQYISK